MTPFIPKFFFLVMLLGWLLNIPFIVWILCVEAKDNRLRPRDIIVCLVCSPFSWPLSISFFVYAFIFPSRDRSERSNRWMLYWLLGYIFILIAMLIAVAMLIVNRFGLAP